MLTWIVTQKGKWMKLVDLYLIRWTIARNLYDRIVDEIFVVMNVFILKEFLNETTVTRIENIHKFIQTPGSELQTTFLKWSQLK